MKALSRRARRVARLIRAGRLTWEEGLAKVRAVAYRSLEADWLCAMCGTAPDIYSWEVLRREMGID